MNKRSFSILALLLLMLCLAPGGYAQSVTTKWGTIQKARGGRDIVDLIGRDNSGFYAVEGKFSGRNRFFLKKYNNDNVELYSKELDLTAGRGAKVELEKVVMVGDRILIFTSYYDRKNDKNIAYVTPLTTDGTLAGANRQIDEIHATKKKNAGNFDFMVSADTTKILVYHNEPYDKNAQEQFSVKIIDKDLNVLWQKHCVAPYQDKDFTISNYTISNDNKVYMLAKVQEGRRDKKDGMPNYSYTILAYAPDQAGAMTSEDEASDAEEYVISLGDKFISSINFELDKNNNLICAGFYSKNSSTDMAGTFYMKIDSKTKQVLQKNVKAFEQEMLEQFMSARKASKEQELYNYNLRRLIPKKDGGSYLIGEQYYMYLATYTDARGHIYYTYHFIYNDIMVVNIENDGNIGWVCRIPKFQHTTNDQGYYSSFATVVLEDQDKICFIYNDNKKNLDVTDPNKVREMGNMNKTVVTIAVVDGHGNYSKAALLNNKDDKVYIRPKMNLQIAQNALLLYGKRGNKYRFGTVKVE